MTLRATIDRFLDVECGTGIVARLGRQRLGDRGRIVVVDASPGMVAMARTVASAIEISAGPTSGSQTETHCLMLRRPD